MTIRRIGLLALAPLLALLHIAPAHAQAAADSPKARCEALAKADFSSVPDAPTEVLAADLVPATDLIPAFCRVQGYVAPQVGVEFHLPVSGWNGKFVMQGCGGMCGDFRYLESCPEAVARGYACGNTDMGHRAWPGSAKWAYNNPIAEIDVGHRGTHVATLAGKAIIARFYSDGPRRSYFLGCSTGGRQGMVEAQRYPLDYDGIVAGSPITYTYTAPLQAFWTATANLDPAGNEIMGIDKLRFLSNRVMQACDAVDGLKDGMITDPRMCRFDVGTLACRPGTGGTGQCLTPPEMTVVRKFYDGPRNAKGPIGTDGGAPLGSELSWSGSFMGQGRNAQGYRVATENLRYLGGGIDPGPAYDLSQFDWDRDPQRLSYSHMAGGNPDLRLFAANGGKLILYHGAVEGAQARTIEYYNMVTAIMGGPERTRAFARMFLVPGFGHCLGDKGVNFFDTLGAIDDWVERGKAPDMLMGYNLPFTRLWDTRDPRFADANRIGPVLAPAGFNGSNIAAMKPAFARPVFPFPDLAIYRSGDPNLAASYKRVPGPTRAK